MSRLIVPSALIAALIGTPALAGAQLVSGGVGPVFPTGEFKSESDPGTGLILSGRVNLSILPLLQLQVELTSIRGWQFGVGDEGPADLGVTTGGANLALHFIRVAVVRPYVLAGLVGSTQSVTLEGVTDEDDFRFGYQTGAGLDFRIGPVTPFVELRWVSLDGPGDIRLSYVPLVLGIKLL